MILSVKFLCKSQLEHEKYDKLEVHSVEPIYLQQRCFDASEPRVLLRRAPNTGTCMGFSRRCRVAVHTLWEKGIRFRHPDYESDRTQKLISSSVSRHLSTCNISSKSMHAFLSNLAHRQTDRQTNSGVRTKTYTSSVVGSK